MPRQPLRGGNVGNNQNVRRHIVQGRAFMRGFSGYLKKRFKSESRGTIRRQTANFQNPVCIDVVTRFRKFSRRYAILGVMTSSAKFVNWRWHL